MIENPKKTPSGYAVSYPFFPGVFRVFGKEKNLKSPVRNFFGGNFAGKFYCVTFAKQNRGVAQLASALAWGARGRKFESSHPDF